MVAIIVLLAAVAGSRPTSAAEGESWHQPVTITVGRKQFVDYRTLRTTGDAVYYQVTLKEPSRVRFEVSIPRSASPKFVPQVVVFQPNDVTIGPLLPLEQPPQTIALVYPVTQPRIVFDAFTQTLTTVRLEAQPSFAQAGTYTFAVYNAGTVAGQFKFSLDQGASLAQWQDAWQMPTRWWRDQMFAGFSWLTLITPLLIGLCLWLVYLRLDHHRLHVHKIYPSRPPKKNTK